MLNSGSTGESDIPADAAHAERAEPSRGRRAPQDARTPRGARRRLLVRGALALLAAGGATAGALVTASPASAGTASVPVGGSKVVCSSQRPGLADRLSRHVAETLRGGHNTPALALYDRHTGTSCTFRGDKPYDSASVVKATVLGTLLRQAQDEHRALTAHEKKLATAMITKSDNDSTSELWHRVGEDRVRHFLKLAGMGHTVPGPHGYWGLTQVTARDQVKLLKLLTAHNSVLDAGSRGYALKLMHRVEPDQRWGTPAGAPSDAAAAVKNGWLERSTKGWRVNSIGAFTGHGHDYGLAVLSHGNKTMDDGIKSIESLSRVVHRDLAGSA